MAVKGTQHTKKMMSVAARFAAQRENNIQDVSVQSTAQCFTDSVSKVVSGKYHIDPLMVLRETSDLTKGGS